MNPQKVLKRKQPGATRLEAMSIRLAKRLAALIAPTCSIYTAIYVYPLNWVQMEGVKRGFLGFHYDNGK